MGSKNTFQLVLFLFLSLNISLRAQNPKLIITTERNADNSVTFNYTKELPGTYTVDIEFTQLNNSDARTHQKLVVGGYNGLLLKLTPADSQKPISFGYKYTTLIGQINPRIDSLVTYRLPFGVNKKIKITEAQHLGEKYFGNEKPKTWKSYIANLKEADTIYAMRKGIVVEIKNDETSDTLTTKSYTSKTNQILIEHEDGTYSRYKGFDKDKIFVNLGQKVYPLSRLGVLGQYNDDIYRLDFMVYYLTDFDPDLLIRQKMGNRKPPYKYLTPNFITENGVQKLEDRTEYKVVCNKEIIFQELSKREKKKFEKEPNLFF